MLLRSSTNDNEDGSMPITYTARVIIPRLSGSLNKGPRHRTHATLKHPPSRRVWRQCVNTSRDVCLRDWDQRNVSASARAEWVKPLYYVHTDDGSLSFGSEIKTLLEAAAVRPELNFAVLPDYLANHSTSGTETLFRGVKRLLPGHTLLWNDGNVEVKQYWDVSFSKASDPGHNERDYIAQWGELFRTSVRLRLMADVPLGMFLSGGIDSSAICAVMSTMVDEPIKTFSVAFAEREANELAYARVVAQEYKTNHHEIVVSPEDFFAALPKLVWHEDEPWRIHRASLFICF